MFVVFIQVERSVGTMAWDRGSLIDLLLAFLHLDPYLFVGIFLSYQSIR